MHVPLRLGESLGVGGWVSGGMAHLQFFGIPSLVVWHLLDLWVRVHLGKRVLDGGWAARRRVGAFTHVQLCQQNCCSSELCVCVCGVWSEVCACACARAWSRWLCVRDREER